MSDNEDYDEDEEEEVVVEPPEDLSHLIEVDLSCKGLTSVPSQLADEVEGRPRLVGFLHLDHNKISELDAAIGKLDQLRTLDLNHNKLDVLPSTIGFWTALKELSINDNQLTELPPSLKYWTRLEKFAASHNKIATFPASACCWTKLTSLSLANNSLTEMPSEIGQMDQLEVLSLDFNQLLRLPQALGKLQKLQTLTVSNNKLVSLPHELGKCKALTKLSVAENRLERLLTNNVKGLQSLTELVCFNNRLKLLPEGVDHLWNLEKLDASGNLIEELPICFGNLSKLKELNVARNKLATLPDTIGECVALETCILGRNPITSLPESFREIRGMINLELNNTKLDANPDFTTFGKLVHLRFDNNAAKVVPSLPAAFKSVSTRSQRQGTSGSPRLKSPTKPVMPGLPKIERPATTGLPSSANADSGAGAGGKPRPVAMPVCLSSRKHSEPMPIILSGMEKAPAVGVELSGMVTLRTYSLIGDLKTAISKAGGVAVVCESMMRHVANAELQTAGAESIRNLCMANKDIEDEGLGSVIDTLMASSSRHSSNPTVQVAVLEAMRNLCAGSSMILLPFPEVPDEPEVVPEPVKDPEEEPEEEAEEEEDEDGERKKRRFPPRKPEPVQPKKACKQHFVETGGVQAILQIMDQHIDDAGVQEAGSYLLQNLSFDPEVRVLLVQEGAVPRTIRGMHNHSGCDLVQMAAFTSLSNFVANDLKMKGLVNQDGGLLHVLESMKAFKGDAALQGAACELLTLLMRDTDCDNSAVLVAVKQGALHLVRTAKAAHGETWSARTGESITELETLLDGATANHLLASTSAVDILRPFCRDPEALMRAVSGSVDAFLAFLRELYLFRCQMLNVPLPLVSGNVGEDGVPVDAGPAPAEPSVPNMQSGGDHSMAGKQVVLDVLSGTATQLRTGTGSMNEEISTLLDALECKVGDPAVWLGVQHDYRNAIDAVSVVVDAKLSGNTKEGGAMPPKPEPGASASDETLNFYFAFPGAMLQLGELIHTYVPEQQALDAEAVETDAWQVTDHKKASKEALVATVADVGKAWKMAVMGSKHKRLMVDLFKPQMDMMDEATELFLASMDLDIPEDPEIPVEEEEEA